MPVQPLTSTTQHHLPVHDIQENLVILKDGAASMVIETTAVNFGLLSEKEQDAIIYAYAALLNSLNFSIQILIHSERKDITAYLDLLTQAEKKQSSIKKRDWIRRYRAFISDTVQRRNILDKKFYLTIPFSSLELGSVKSLSAAVSPLKAKADAPIRLPAPLDEIIRKAQTALVPKRDHILRQLERIGLSARQLTNKELLSLLYRTYNPGAFAPPINPDQMLGPIVEPIVKNEQTNKNSNEQKN